VGVLSCKMINADAALVSRAKNCRSNVCVIVGASVGGYAAVMAA